MMEETVSRAQGFVEAQRAVAVVADQPRRWWHGIEVAMPPPGRTAVQLKNRGTANGNIVGDGDERTHSSG